MADEDIHIEEYDHPAGGWGSLESLGSILLEEHVALAEIARELRALEPSEAVFYTSGRASLEASYLYQLMVRMYGCNDLPDSSNMCHESTSVALPKTIGASIGTVTLEDFDQTDCMRRRAMCCGS